MPWQLIYTSTPRGLNYGQSGFATVARSAELREALVQRLEQVSAYEHLPGSNEGATPPSPVIGVHRWLDLRGTRYHVLTRIVDAGLDFTKRTNHLAHHLVFEPTELTQLPSPAAILAHWNGWLADWQGEPRLLEAEDWGNLFELPLNAALPARTWAQISGDAGRAAALLEPELFAGCCVLTEPRGEKRLLELWGETLELLNDNGHAPERRWEIPFTTYLQAQDPPADFRWRGVWPGSPAQIAAARGGVPVVSLPHLKAPNIEWARVARHGWPVPVHVEPPQKQTTTESSSAEIAKTERRQQVSPENATAAQLRYQHSGRDTSHGEPAASASHHGPPLDSESWRGGGRATTLVLFLLLLASGAAAWWLHTQKSRASNRPDSHRASKSPPATSSKQRPPKYAPSESMISLGSDGSSASATSAVPNSFAPVPLPDTALEQLTNRIDGALTYLFLAAKSPATPLTGATELERLLQRMLQSTSPILPSEVECRAQTGTVALTLDPRAEAVPLLLTFGKALSGHGQAGWQFRFDAADWHAGTATAIPFVAPELPQFGALSLLFRSARGQRSFAPFRLVVAAPDSMLAPTILDRAFLRWDGTNFATSIAPELASRLSFVRLPPDLKWRFVPYVGADATNATEIFDRDWPSDHAPALGMELNFAATRARVQRTRDAQQARWDAAQAQVRQSPAATTRADERDFELGRWLGRKPGDDYYSFATWRRRVAGPATRDQFRTYLFRALEGAVDSTLRVQMSSEETRARAFVEIERQLRDGKVRAPLPNFPSGALQRRWDLFAEEEKLVAAAAEAKRLEKETRSWNERLARIPTNPPPRVSLIATDGTRRVEVFRFVAP